MGKELACTRRVSQGSVARARPAWEAGGEPIPGGRRCDSSSQESDLGRGYRLGDSVQKDDH